MRMSSSLNGTHKDAIRERTLDGISPYRRPSGTRRLSERELEAIIASIPNEVLVRLLRSLAGAAAAATMEHHLRRSSQFIKRYPL